MRHALDGRRILVTGGTGFLGRHLVRTLAEETDVSLRLLTRGAAAEDLPAAARAGAELVRGDLLAPDSLGDLCVGIDTVIHVAALEPRQPSRRSLNDYRRLNLDATLTLAISAAAFGVRRFVFVSDTAAAAPSASHYEVTKRLAEDGLLELGARTGLEIAVIRPCPIAGEGQRGGPLLRMFKLCRRGLYPVPGGRLDVAAPLVDVEDVAHALMLAATAGRPGQIYPVTSGVRHTLGEMLAIAGSLTGNPRPHLSLPLPVVRAAAMVAEPLARLAGKLPWSPERLDQPLANGAIDIGETRRELGYRPHFRILRSMLARTYAWYGMSGQL